jgi:hypothetical protein
MGGLKDFQHEDGSWGLDPQAGYMGRIDPQRYMGYCLDYAEDSARDGVIAATIFTTDGAHPWIESMDTHGIHELWKACGKQKLGQLWKDQTYNLYVPIVVMDGPQVVTGDPHYGDDEDEVASMGAIDPQVLQAILQIESGGAAFGKDGRLTLRFEAHIFKRQLANDAVFNQHFQIAASRPWVAQQWLRLAGGVLEPIHTGSQATEYRAFERARGINAEAAYRSVSMGAAQIMGFNHARIGYPSAETMFNDFQRSQAAQIVGFLNFMLTNATLMHAVRRKDWRLIAELYNGAGAVDTYATLLEQAYRERTSG